MTLPRPCERVAAIAPYRSGSASRACGLAVLDRNENPHGPLPAVAAVLAASAGAWNRYPDHEASALRTALARRAGRTIDEVAVGCGSVGLLRQIFTAYVERGDTVLYGWPSFEMLPVLTLDSEARALAVPTCDHRFDMAQLTRHALAGPKLIVITSPNTPTGTCVGHGELAALLAMAPASTLVVLDEAYHEYATGPELVQAHELARRHRNLVVLRTFSKAYGLAALRIGYLFADPDVVATLARVALPYPTSSIAQLAAAASLDADVELTTRVTATLRERDRVIAGVRELGVPVVEPQANFVWLPVGPGARRLTDELEQRGVLVRCYPQEGVRVTIGAPADNARFLAALADVVR